MLSNGVLTDFENFPRRPPSAYVYRIRMDKSDTKEVLWANVLELMSQAYGREHLSKFAADVGIGNASMTRIKERQTSVGVDILEKVAKRFSLEPWQLLVPGMARNSPPSEGGGRTPLDEPGAGPQSDPQSAEDALAVTELEMSDKEVLALLALLDEQERQALIAGLRRSVRARLARLDAQQGYAGPNAARGR